MNGSGSQQVAGGWERNGGAELSAGPRQEISRGADFFEQLHSGWFICLVRNRLHGLKSSEEKVMGQRLMAAGKWRNDLPAGGKGGKI